MIAVITRYKIDSLFRFSVALVLVGALHSRLHAQQFDLSTERPQIGDIYICDPDICFEFDSYEICTDSFPLLDSIAVFLADHPTLVIEIGSHRDTRGPAQSAKDLGQARARSIVDYLKSRYIDPRQLRAKSYGESVPIVSEKDIKALHTDQEREEAHALNRRIELKVMTIRKS